MRSGWPERVRQFRRALRPRPAAGDRAFAAARLTPAELALFERQAAYERQHAVELARTLLARRPDVGRDLLVAALLHDLGKAACPPRPLERVAYVLLAALPGRPPDRLFPPGTAPRCRALRALWVLRHHARLGAESARRAGVAPRVAWLIEHHHDAIPALGDPDLRLLQAIDEGMWG